MACCLMAPSNYLNQSYQQLGSPRSEIFHQATTIFIQENAFENFICKVPAILARP